jgi:hypothetical protein
MDKRPLGDFQINGVWEMATPEQAEERKREYNAAKATHTRAYTHSRKDRQNLAKSSMLSPQTRRRCGVTR